MNVANAFYLTLFAVSVAGIGVSLFNAIAIIKMHGLPVLFAAICVVAASILLFLSLWQPFRHHTLFSNGPNGNLITFALALFYLPNAVAWLQRRHKGNTHSHNDA